MSQPNAMVVRRAIDEIWNRGNYALLGEIAADDIVIHASSPGEDIQGHAGIVRFYDALRAAFPDLHFSVEDQIAAGDRVVTRWTASGTHTGEFHGIPPTGKAVRISGIDIDRIVGGKVVECWPEANELGLLQQLGVLPVPELVAG